MTICDRRSFNSDDGINTERTLPTEFNAIGVFCEAHLYGNANEKLTLVHDMVNTREAGRREIAKHIKRTADELSSEG